MGTKADKRARRLAAALPVLEVQVHRARATGVAHVPDHLAALHTGAGADGDGIHVAVVELRAAAALEHDAQRAVALTALADHDAVLDREDRHAAAAHEVHALVAVAGAGGAEAVAERGARRGADPAGGDRRGDARGGGARRAHGGLRGRARGGLGSDERAPGLGADDALRGQAVRLLERDDRGMFKDVILLDGKEISNPLNQEIVAMRGLEDGEYVVNVVHYIANGTAPLPVQVKVEKLNPTVKVIFYQTLQLKGTGDEETAVRFTLKGQDVINVNSQPKSLVELTRSSSGKDGGGGGGQGAQGGQIDAATGQVIH